MKNFLILLTLAFSLQTFSISTEEVFYNEFANYYSTADYEVNFCHKNHALLLRHLKEKGADLTDIQVLIIQQDKTKPRLTPQNGLYDNSYAWHVVILYEGIVYDLNAKHSADGVPLNDYFPYVLGYDTKMSNILLRVYGGNTFFEYFFNEDGSPKKYSPSHFIKNFLSKNALSPLITASMLKWY